MNAVPIPTSTPVLPAATKAKDESASSGESIGTPAPETASPVLISTPGRTRWKRRAPIRVEPIACKTATGMMASPLITGECPLTNWKQ